MFSDEPLSRRSLAGAATASRPGRRSGAGLRLRHRQRALGVLLSAALVAAAVLGSSSASAAPKPTIAEAKATIKKLQEKQEQASEQYNETQEQLKSVEVRLAAARTKLARQREALSAAKVKMGQLAAETYRQGELSTLGALLGDDTNSALARSGYLPSLGQRQTSAMKRLDASEQKLAATATELKEQQAKAKAAKATMGTAKATVEKHLAQAQAELDRLNAAERARVVAALAAEDDPPADSGGGSKSSGGGSSGGGGTTSCAGKAVTAATAAGKAAIEFACAQLGEPYVWGGDGPGEWDCSGLTMEAFAAGGVSLPHSSRMQAGYGTRVSLSDLQPGDLVFFYSPIGHVGIYLGNNTMVHAPNSTTVVKVASLYATPTAAVRL